MVLLTLPSPLRDHVLQYLDVRMMSPIRVLQKCAALVFETKYTPQFHFALTKPMDGECGWRARCGPNDIQI